MADVFFALTEDESELLVNVTLVGGKSVEFYIGDEHMPLDVAVITDEGVRERQVLTVKQLAELVK